MATFCLPLNRSIFEIPAPNIPPQRDSFRELSISTTVGSATVENYITVPSGVLSFRPLNNSFRFPGRVASTYTDQVDHVTNLPCARFFSCKMANLHPSSPGKSTLVGMGLTA